MAVPLEYRIFDQQQLVFTAELAGLVELGRQERGDQGPYLQVHEGNLCRLIVARFDEDKISRKHVLIEPLPGSRIKLTNLSKSLPVSLPHADDLEPQGSVELTLPALFGIGAKTVRIQALEESLQTLGQATVAPGLSRLPSTPLAGLKLPASGELDVEQFARWMQTSLEVVQSAAGSHDFFARAVKAIVDLVGLDSSGILMRQAGDWTMSAFQLGQRGSRATEWKPSQRILHKVAKEKRTFWETPAEGGVPVDRSLLGVKAVVASPILDRQGEVLGVLYGDRRQEGNRQPISKLEALLVELLASGVAAGLARIKEEEAALRDRTLFEQFFPPELARALLANRELLKGRDEEVTVLFCDIRAFSRISARLGPASTVEWINATFGVLSECVLAEHGVLVDYIGDELLAMWGAPVTQPDHARRACRAALAMLRALPRLNQRWQPLVKESVRIGIGLNTGVARVGNVGSDFKFKYGPLGNAVTLASRVQGATKYLKTPLLFTQATQAQLGPGLAPRRLGQVRMVNLAEPVTLFELSADESSTWSDLKARYEEALRHYEQQRFHQTARLLGQLLSENPQDGPSLSLMSRAIYYLDEEAEDFDPVWELPGK